MTLKFHDLKYSIGLGNWVYQVPVQFSLYSGSNWNVSHQAAINKVFGKMQLNLPHINVLSRIYIPLLLQSAENLHCKCISLTRHCLQSILSALKSKHALR